MGKCPRGYLQQIRSSRRLEAEYRRNLEVMWLLRRLQPDYKSIAEFRRIHREAVTEAGAELVRFARSAGLVRGEWVAIDGSKFQAVSSARSVREREALERYLDGLDGDRGCRGAGGHRTLAARVRNRCRSSEEVAV